MITLFIWIVLGFLAGFFAKAIIPRPDGGGTILKVILGIVGAIVDGLFGHFMGFEMASSFNNLSNSLPSFIF